MTIQTNSLNPKLIKVNKKKKKKSQDHFQLILSITIENKQSTLNDKQPRSPAITIARSNNRAPPQIEPFFRPKHLPISNQQQQQQQQLSHSLTNDIMSHSLPNNTDSDEVLNKKSTVTNTNEKKQRSQASDEHPEEPRTPHSRAKNIARFYPVTKDTPVVKPDVRNLI